MSRQTAVLALVDIASDSRGWGLFRYILGPRVFKGQSGLQFCKVLGSGFNGGFSTKPSLSKQGFFCVFESPEQADAFRDASPIVDLYRQHAHEFFIATVQAYSSRGSWSGFSMATTTEDIAQRPIASLTRASIKPTKAVRFWEKAKPAERAIELASGKILTAGLGEAPYLRQATFTIWENTQALEDYAQQGAHLAAIKSAYGNAYFSESMFTRFIVKSAKGVWQGKHVQIN
ncbi:spheroidene monooxygenase [Polynucleobacter antarcticus]|uniref:Spheroidene monooxygenase n=1 Tax=Polynucleobacter antarcticus TaxID=1743162 RepID=A0A6M9PQP9_9BURK|nr:spheroidene monooxygenase [Polynucleobacter antarcticus]QKM62202.1 spheroidene monooxygenase [Polynucleobacter antarcticus]